LKNNNLYNDKEFFEDGDLNWYDYGFRNYDPQIGRFVQIDPLTDDYGSLTPYQYAGNDPIGNSDEDGLSIISDVGRSSTGLLDVVVTNTPRAVHLPAEVVTRSGAFINISTKTIAKVVNITNVVVKTVQVGHQIIGNKNNISEHDWQSAAKELGVNNTASLKAIHKQESAGAGFLKDGRSKILFERHYMYRLLKQRGYSKAKLSELEELYPNIINTNPQQKGTYGTYPAQYDKMKIAESINVDAALQSASYGSMQVMGTNYKGLYKTPTDMYNAQQYSSLEQLKFFIHEVKTLHPNLAKELNAKDWEGVAGDYNGKMWRKTNPDYADNLKTYFNKFNKK